MDRPVRQFADAATEAGCAVERTADGGFESTLGDSLDAPAVGTPLPFDGLGLPSAVTLDPTPDDLARAAVGVTPARFGIAEYGSIGIESTIGGEQGASLWSAHHVAILAASDVVADMAAAVERIDELAAEGADVVIATGPSATADMGELVVGAHGPERTTVIVLEDR